jgi:hypothetical protein
MIVVAKLPNAGLANCLFVWSRAALFAKKHGLKLYVLGWNRIHIGPYLRGERVKRNYLGFFKDQMPVVKELWLKTKWSFSSDKIYNPESIEECTKKGAKLIIFDDLPPWSDYFKYLKKDRLLVKSLLLDNLKPSIQDKLEKLKKPEVGIHIRMGDFRELKEGEDFSKVGLVRTPLTYFKDVLSQIRDKANLNAIVFSDGTLNELEEILTLKKVKKSKEQRDILDLLQLSKSQIIVTSASSSFSLWASFLSGAIIIMHPDHIHAPTRIEANLIETTYPIPEEVLSVMHAIKVTN